MCASSFVKKNNPHSSKIAERALNCVRALLCAHVVELSQYSIIITTIIILQRREMGLKQLRNLTM